MTLAIAYKNDDKTIYAFDFRITINNGNIQLDNSFKFKELNKKMGFFLAGDVKAWKVVFDKIDNISQRITVDNILSETGPILNEINQEIWLLNAKDYKSGQGIGFILDQENNTNIQFKILFRPGCGLKIEEIKNGEFVIIGSLNDSQKIEIEKKAESYIESYKKVYGDNLYEMATGMRNAVIEYIKLLGENSFSQLGISPVMGIACLFEDKFYICGEEITSEEISRDCHIKSYSSELKLEKDNIILRDNKKGIESILYDIDSIDDKTQGNKIDPFELEKNNIKK